MEVTSILENIAILNPDLAADGFLKIFKKTTKEENGQHETGNEA